MSRWWSMEVTPPGCDYTIVLMATGATLVIAIVNLAHGEWRTGGWFTYLTIIGLVSVWRIRRQAARRRAGGGNDRPPPRVTPGA